MSRTTATAPRPTYWLHRHRSLSGGWRWSWSAAADCGTEYGEAETKAQAREAAEAWLTARSVTAVEG